MNDGRPQNGQPAPDFTLPAPGGTRVRLAELCSKGPVVLFFYPRDATPGCTVEACGFRDSYQDFQATRAQIVGISRDGLAAHESFAAQLRLPFLLLSDEDGEVHARYGVRRRLGGLLRDRVTFVIDRQGIVRDVFAERSLYATHVTRALDVVRSLPAG